MADYAALKLCASDGIPVVFLAGPAPADTSGPFSARTMGHRVQGNGRVRSRYTYIGQASSGSRNDHGSLLRRYTSLPVKPAILRPFQIVMTALQKRGYLPLHPQPGQQLFRSHYAIPPGPQNRRVLPANNTGLRSPAHIPGNRCGSVT